MAENGIGDYFISDIDDDLLEDDDELIPAPVVVPAHAAAPAPVAPVVEPAPAQQPPSIPAPAPQAPVVPAQTSASVESAAPAPAPIVPAPPQAPAAPVAPVAAQFSPQPQTGPRPATREERLANALDQLMIDSTEIQASALVSLDGFIMASALPPGMQEDRVGAMSAAILGLGERAAAELGRGHLSQVFIEGAEGYVILISAGQRAALTVMAQPQARLGLVLYDMKSAATRIAEILD